MKTCVLCGPWLSSMLRFQHVGRVSTWMCYWAILSSTSHWWCILEFPSTHTAWALETCATACASKHVFSARWSSISFYLCGSRSSGSNILANVDRLCWPNCLFTETESPRLLPVVPLEEHGLTRHLWIQRKTCCAGYGCGECWTTRYWWSCVQEHGTYVGVEVADHHTEPFL